MQKQLCFRNLSHTPIDFNVRALYDGYEDPLTHEQFAQAQSKPKLPNCPREFFICPSEGTIKPQNTLRMQVSMKINSSAYELSKIKKLIVLQLCYTPNVIRDGDVLIQICLCQSPNAEPILLPVICNARSATFEIDPSEVNVEFCFVNFPYCRKLVITNSSDREGYFYIIPQEVL